MFEMKLYIAFSSDTDNLCMMLHHVRNTTEKRNVRKIDLTVYPNDSMWLKFFQGWNSRELKATRRKHVYAERWKFSNKITWQSDNLSLEVY
jgi:hypothetical protein